MWILKQSKKGIWYAEVQLSHRMWVNITLKWNHNALIWFWYMQQEKFMKIYCKHKQYVIFKSSFDPAHIGLTSIIIVPYAR